MKKISLMQKLILCGLTTMSLSGCMNTGWESNSSLLIYQPDFLYLKKGTEIQTQKGMYRPQIDEIWVSEKKYKDALK